MTDEHLLRLAMMGASIAACRAIIPAFEAIGRLNTNSEREEVVDARDAADKVVAVLTEFIERCNAATSN